MRLSGLLRNRLFGFRLIEVSALVLLIGLAVGVYLAKVWGGRESQEIARIEREIRDEHRRIRLLQAEVAFQEQPERIGRIAAEQLKYAPPSPKVEVDPAELVDVARGAKKPPAPLAPAAVVAPAAPVVIPTSAPAAPAKAAQ